MLIKKRKINQEIKKKLIINNVDKRLASILAGRDIDSVNHIDYSLKNLLPPNTLHNAMESASFLFDAIESNKKIIIIGDYDADGATATACGVLGLRKFGANVNYLVPNRFKFGYGLTPAIVEQALNKDPDLIITVDNGIASIEGVKLARDNNVDVIITDHHLPAEQLPNANFIINPNQQECSFESKNLCGVGVIFYLLLSLRIIYREKGRYKKKSEPKLNDLLDLVAFGTIADLVKLDYNNRILVEYGMRCIRESRCNFGIQAIAMLSKKILNQLKTSDISFSIAPKINAAGRLDDMAIGIKCLISDNFQDAENFAKQLLSLNSQRCDIELKMHTEALDNLQLDILTLPFSVCMYDKNWHQGVIGILASRIKEKFYRPTIIFAKDENGVLKGSGRSIPTLHLRDTLDIVAKKNPNLLVSFGGHAMAAGLTIEEKNYIMFKEIFEESCSSLLKEDDLNLEVHVDESILDESIKFDCVKKIDMNVWGQGFNAPLFIDEFEIFEQEKLLNKHTKCKLGLNNKIYEGIIFSYTDHLPDRIKAVYSVESNEFRGNKKIQLILRDLIK